MATTLSKDKAACVLALIPTTPVRAISRQFGLSGNTIRKLRRKYYPELEPPKPSRVSKTGVGKCDFVATIAMPGSAEKIAVLTSRVQAGHPLVHPGDAQGALPPRALFAERERAAKGIAKDALNRPLEMPELSLCVSFGGRNHMASFFYDLNGEGE